MIIQVYLTQQVVAVCVGTVLLERVRVSHCLVNVNRFYFFTGIFLTVIDNAQCISCILSSI